MNDERKSFTYRIEIKNEAAGEVGAVIAKLGVVDKDLDVLLPGTFPLNAKVKLSSYGHDVVTSAAPPVGDGVVFERGNEAIFGGRFYMGTERGREAFQTIKEMGSNCDWSFGWNKGTTQTEPLSDYWKSQGARRVITGLIPIEVSPVFVGAGQGTGTLYTKSAEGDAEEQDRIRRYAALSETLRKNAEKWEEWDQLKKYKALSEALRDNSNLDPDPGVERKLLAHRVARSACAFWNISQPRIRWFSPDGTKSGQYDEEKTVIWLSTDLSDDQLIITYGHELEHHRQYLRGHLFNCVAAESAGELTLERFRRERSSMGLSAYR
jgi:hypothetical protein